MSAALLALLALRAFGGGAAAWRPRPLAEYVGDGDVCEGNRSDFCRNYLGDCAELAAISTPCKCVPGYGAQIIRSEVLEDSNGLLGLVYTCCPGWDSQDCGAYSAARDRRFQMAGAVLLPAGAAGVALAVWWLRRGGLPLTAASAAEGALEKEPAPMDGMLLHQEVPMHKWCVTLDDCIHIRQLVLCAVQRGLIRPTDLDPFDPEDTTMGPNMYSVNEQYIKPVTAKAGCMSWALMRHPTGLECDLFLTHSWSEGFFEFIDKVVNSWPAGARHAYSCMLSNPQNLDISRLLSEPLDSPFAAALRSASHVLAVPNARHSIYSRLWCSYEAYLAYSWGKTIETAEPPPRHLWPRTFQATSMYFVSAGAFWVLAPVIRRSGGALLCLIAMVVTVLSVILKHYVDLERPCLAWPLQAAFDMAMGTLGAGVPWAMPTLVSSWTFFALLGVAPGAFAADILWAKEAARQARQLQKDFTGRLCDAKCSVPSDGQRIHAEIQASGSVRAVDHAVLVLICMGRSTPTLRKVASIVGELGNATHYSLTHIVLMLAFTICGPAQSIGLRTWGLSDLLEKRPWLMIWHHAAVLAEGLIFALLFVRMTPDRRVFAARSVIILSAPIGFASLCEVLFKWHQHRPITFKWPAVLGGLVLFPLLLVGVALGPLAVVRLPLVGPALVRLILAGGKGSRHVDEEADDQTDDDSGATNSQTDSLLPDSEL